MIEIPRDIREQIVAHALAGVPHEACGLLAARDGAVQHFFTMTNADHSPYIYRLDPKEQIEVFEEIESKGWDLYGIVHSHTHTEAYPSETDRRQAFYPEAYHVLVSLQDRNNPVLRAFTIREGVVDEVEVRIA